VISNCVELLSIDNPCFAALILSRPGRSPRGHSNAERCSPVFALFSAACYGYVPVVRTPTRAPGRGYGGRRALCGVASALLEPITPPWKRAPRESARHARLGRSPTAGPADPGAPIRQGEASAGLVPVSLIRGVRASYAGNGAEAPALRTGKGCGSEGWAPRRLLRVPEEGRARICEHAACAPAQRSRHRRPTGACKQAVSARRGSPLQTSRERRGQPR
jgi:hypothetical protein